MYFYLVSLLSSLIQIIIVVMYMVMGLGVCMYVYMCVCASVCVKASNQHQVSSVALRLIF